MYNKLATKHTVQYTLWYNSTFSLTCLNRILGHQTWQMCYDWFRPAIPRSSSAGAIDDDDQPQHALCTQHDYLCGCLFLWRLLWSLRYTNSMMGIYPPRHLPFTTQRIRNYVPRWARAFAAPSIQRRRGTENGECSIRKYLPSNPSDIFSICASRTFRMKTRGHGRNGGRWLMWLSLLSWPVSLTINGISMSG